MDRRREDLYRRDRSRDSHYHYRNDRYRSRSRSLEKRSSCDNRTRTRSRSRSRSRERTTSYSSSYRNERSELEHSHSDRRDYRRSITSTSKYHDLDRPESESRQPPRDENRIIDKLAQIKMAPDAVKVSEGVSIKEMTSDGNRSDKDEIKIITE